jgi:hypothetical protein
MNPVRKKIQYLLSGGSSPLLVGLAHAWKLDDQGWLASRVASVGGRDLTNYGKVGSVYTVMGQASSFIRKCSTYLESLDDTSLRFGNENFEMTCIFRPMKVDQEHWLVGKWCTIGGGGREYAIHVTSLNKLLWMVRNPANTAHATLEAVTLGPIELGISYFIDVYHDADNDVIGISVNGGAFDTQAWTVGVRESTSDFRIGMRSDGVTSSLVTDGDISDVYMWRRLLKPAERIALYNGGSPLRYPFKKHVSAAGGTVTIEYPRSRFANRVPCQRANFYAQGRYWAFLTRYDVYGADTSSLFYTSSTDGNSWERPRLITTIGYADAQFNVELEGTKVHLTKNIQKGATPTPGVHDGMEYRRGSLNTDGTISWDAAWQTVIATGNFVGDHSVAIATDGAVWIGYADSGSGDGVIGNAVVVRNDNTDGTWSTTLGFPLTVQAGITNDANAFIVPIDAGKIYALVHEWDNNRKAKGYTVDSLCNITADGEITAYTVEAVNGSYAKVARIGAIGLGDGIVHIGYQTNIATIRYFRRNADESYEAEVELADSSYVVKAISSPTFAMDASGNVYMYWSTDSKIYLCKHDGSSWSGPTAVVDEGLEAGYEHVKVPELITTSRIPVLYSTDEEHSRIKMTSAG